LGFSPQKPTRRALERDEERIRAWIEQDWPRVKKRRAPESSPRFPRRIRDAHGPLGASLLERVRTDPATSAARQKVSAIAALCIPPRDRIALYFRLCPNANINSQLDFLEHLQRQLRMPIMLI